MKSELGKRLQRMIDGDRLRDPIRRIAWIQQEDGSIIGIPGESVKPPRKNPRRFRYRPKKKPKH